ncbi:MAG: lipocalin-like domain-containing protein [Smithellaceae bacterium]|nr:lipocalin-like domain-containing protein [Smithellaceae bacterium]
MGEKGVAVESLIGAWRLISFQSRTADGQSFFPFGAGAKGYVLFSASNFMCVAIMAENRPVITAKDLIETTVEQRAEAAATYISYAGPFTLREGLLVTRAEVSFYPHWVGTDQVRICELFGDKLTLTTPPVLVFNTELTSILTWEKC